jgi:hypothetical protein
MGRRFAPSMWLERRHPGHEQLAALDDVRPDRSLEQLLQ